MKKQSKITTLKLVNMLLRTCDTRVYRLAPTTEHVHEAIKLAKLCKSHADKGQTEEAMHIASSQWDEVITKLEKKLS